MGHEVWADIEGFPSHQVSTYGNVRNKKTGHVLKPFADRYGYLRLSLGNVDNVYIHKLVAETFIGCPIGERMQINHIDCDRQNNHVDNLEWCTASENIRWGVTKGNINPHKGLARAVEVNKRRIKIVDLDIEFDSVKECAEYLGVCPTHISRHMRAKSERYHGYRLEYID